MSARAHGQVRRGQVLTTYGPGAMIDLPRHSAIVGGLDTWPESGLEEVVEPRLTRYLAQLTGLPQPRLLAPPAASDRPGEPSLGIVAFRFPEWFVVQEGARADGKDRSRRLVHRKSLDEKGTFEKRPVVATRFVRACPRGHVDDIDWFRFAHRGDGSCRRPLWLDERGTTGDLFELTVRCECGASRGVFEATMRETFPLGSCTGARPWLGRDAREDCQQPARLLVRTASNAYFAHVVSVLSLPDRAGGAVKVVREHWNVLSAVDSEAELAFARKIPAIHASLVLFTNEEVMEAIRVAKRGPASERPVKQVELDALLAAPEGYGDDVPVDPDFHARRLPDGTWRKPSRWPGVEAVVQLHRLREVRALVGFTRFEPVLPDVDGGHDSDVERAQLAVEPRWLPAVENRGEGVFLQLRPAAVREWLGRPAVARRLAELAGGHERWLEERARSAGGRPRARPFVGGPYVLLHTLSHLLVQSLALRCGYPAASLSERIYVDHDGGRFGILLMTASPDAEGTLGGLVQQARHLDEHLARALEAAALCSNDPTCAQHEPRTGMEERRLHGAACHGCVLISETSCEMRNDYLDRALVVPVLGLREAAFFGPGA